MFWRQEFRRCVCHSGASESGGLLQSSKNREAFMDEATKQQQAAQVQIKADEKEMLGQYSNLVMIHHNPEEFTMNFIYIFPNATQGAPQGKLVSSLIVSPGHAKRLARALAENISRYEAQNGAIKESTVPVPTPSVGL